MTLKCTTAKQRSAILRCRRAEGDECTCSCEGKHHGKAQHASWIEVGESTLVRGAGTRVAARPLAGDQARKDRDQRLVAWVLRKGGQLAERQKPPVQLCDGSSETLGLDVRRQSPRFDHHRVARYRVEQQSSSRGRDSTARGRFISQHSEPPLRRCVNQRLDNGVADRALYLLDQFLHTVPRHVI